MVLNTIKTKVGSMIREKIIKDAKSYAEQALERDPHNHAVSALLDILKGNGSSPQAHHPNRFKLIAIVRGGTFHNPDDVEYEVMSIDWERQKVVGRSVIGHHFSEMDFEHVRITFA